MTLIIQIIFGLSVMAWTGGLPVAAQSHPGNGAVPGLKPSAANGSNHANAEIFWRSNRDGWFWYKAPAPDEELAEKDEAQVHLPARPFRNAELEEFEAFQKRLGALQKIAIINPTPKNVRAYMVY